MKVNGRNIVAVHIRGLAFKAGSGTRRESVLLNLKKLDELSNNQRTLLFVTGLVVGFSAGVLTAWWWL